MIDTIRQQAEWMLSELRCSEPGLPYRMRCGGDQTDERISWDDKELKSIARDVDFYGEFHSLSDVLAHIPSDSSQHFRADDVHRTMLLCEGLAINFLYDHGDTDAGVRYQP